MLGGWAVTAEHFQPSSCHLGSMASCDKNFTCHTQAWRGTQQIDPLEAKLSDIFWFVLILFVKTLLWAQLKCTLWLFLLFLLLSDPPSLFKSTVVICFMKGLQHLFPLSLFVMPQWDQLGSKVSAVHSLQAASQLLLAATHPQDSVPCPITSALRVRELQALCVKLSYTTSFQNKLVLRTRASFLPKVVTVFYVS